MAQNKSLLTRARQSRQRHQQLKRRHASRVAQAQASWLESQEKNAQAVAEMRLLADRLAEIAVVPAGAAPPDSHPFTLVSFDGLIGNNDGRYFFPTQESAEFFKGAAAQMMRRPRESFVICLHPTGKKVGQDDMASSITGGET
jgi:hypothetical protein